MAHATRLAICLISTIALTGCTRGAGAPGTEGAAAPDAARAGDVPQEQMTAQYGHVVSVRFENRRAYDLVQKAMYWRGRGDKSLAVDELSQSQRLDYLMGVDTETETRDDADLYVSEAEALRAYEAEFRRARRQLRLDYLETQEEMLLGSIRVAE